MMTSRIQSVGRIRHHRELVDLTEITDSVELIVRDPSRWFDAIGADETTSASQEYCWLRIACHLMVHCMPNEGLTEAIESLKEMRDFYDDRKAAPALLPSEPTRVTGRVVRFQERPAFDIEED